MSASSSDFENLAARARAQDDTDPAVLGEVQRLAMNLADQMERHRQRESNVAALVDAAREFTALLDLDSLLKTITRRARLMLGADMAYIGVPDERADDRSIYIRASNGHTSMLNIGLRLPGTAGVGNRAVTNNSPFWTSDYLTDARIEHSRAIDDVVAAERLHAIMVAPLSAGAQPYGALYVAARVVRHFTADEVSLMSSLADLAGVAIERAMLHEHTADVIADLERRQAAAEAAAASFAGFGSATARILALAAGGSDLAGMLGEAQRHVGGALQLCSVGGDVLITVGDMPEVDPDTLTAIMVQVQSAREPAGVQGGLWAMPLHSGGRHFGVLLARPGRELDDAGWNLLLVVAHTATLYLQVESRAADVGDQGRDDLLDDLLADPQRSSQQLVKQALRMGMDLSQPHVVVVMRPKGDSLGRIDVWASSFSHRSVGLKTLHRGCVVLLLPGSDPEALVRAAYDNASASLCEELTASASSPISGPASVIDGYREALRCLEAMAALGLDAQASSARELGFIGILLADHHDVDGFVKIAIGPILDYDQLRSTDLTRTLEAYFEEGGSPTYAARKLHVHPNTVARRLDRITGLLGPDWQTPSQALEVQLALKLHRVRTLITGPAADGPSDGQLA